MSDALQIVRSWIGQSLVVTETGPEAHPDLWEPFCAAVEDGNPIYWDDAAAVEHTGVRIAPQSMLAAWVVAPEWRPVELGQSERPLEAHFKVKDALGYPNGIVLEAEFEYHEPVKRGDRLRATQSLISLGDEKQTRLGVGREWVIGVTLTNQRNECAGVQTFRFLGYGAA